MYYGWFEFIVIILVFIAPYFLKPGWLWRLIFTYLVLLGAIIFVLRSMFHPQMMFQEHVDTKKVNIFLRHFVYIGTGMFLIGMIWYVFIPMSIDIYALILERDNVVTSIVEVEDTSYGGSVNPYFIAQSLKFRIDGKLHTYYLPFYRLPLSPGEYELVYSPRTYFVWDVIRKVD